MAKSDDSIPHNRRAFFGEALAKLVQPVAELLDGQLGEHLLGDTLDKPLLRPPGALPETEFLDTCSRCGKCVESCPAEAIHPLPGNASPLAGTPYIDPDYQPCVVCDTLACMQVCPSGALQKLSVNEIQIGLAVVDHQTCLRSKDIDCIYCVSGCPIGETAIRFDSDGQVEVIAAGCVGCGVCQSQCPTAPKSIVVQPFPQVPKPSA